MRASSAAFLVMLAPAMAFAEEGHADFAVLAPRADGVSSASIPRAVESLRASLTERGIAAPDQAELRRRRDETVGDLSPAREALEEAATRFVEMDFAASTAAYERAKAVLRARHADLLGDGLVVDAAIGVARAQLAEGRMIRAREEIRLALAAEPTLRLDPAEHPPELVDLFEEVRADVETTVRPSPPPERLCAAARDLGSTHAATFELRRVGDATEMTLELRDAVSCERTGTGVVQVRGDDDAAWEASSRNLTAQVVAPPPAVVAEIEPVPPPRRVPERPRRPSPPSDPWYGRWYVWAGAGAVVTGVAAALILPTLGDDTVRHQGGVGIE